jgi:hypothetical protein
MRWNSLIKAAFRLKNTSFARSARFARSSWSWRKGIGWGLRGAIRRNHARSLGFLSRRDLADDAAEIGSATVSVASSRPTRKRLPNKLFCSPAGWPRQQTTHFSVNLVRALNAFGEKSEQTRAAPLAVLPKAAGETPALPNPTELQAAALGHRVGGFGQRTAFPQQSIIR